MYIALRDSALCIVPREDVLREFSLAGRPAILIVVRHDFPDRTSTGYHVLDVQTGMRYSAAQTSVHALEVAERACEERDGKMPAILADAERYLLDKAGPGAWGIRDVLLATPYPAPLPALDAVA